MLIYGAMILARTSDIATTPERQTMIKTIYSQYRFTWVLDTDSLTPQEREDLRTVRCAVGSYGAGTAPAEAAARLADAGVTVKFVLDGGPRVFLNGTLI